MASSIDSLSVSTDSPFRLIFAVQIEQLYLDELGDNAALYGAYYKLACLKSAGLAEKFSTFRKSILKSIFYMSHLIFSHLSAAQVAAIAAAAAPLITHQQVEALDTPSVKLLALEINKAVEGTAPVYDGNPVRLLPLATRLQRARVCVTQSCRSYLRLQIVNVRVFVPYCSFRRT